MRHIKLDPRTAELFASLTGNVEIHDQDGKVIGYFRPKLDPAKFPGLEPPPLSHEEIERLVNEPGRRYTTEEVIDLAKRRAAGETP